MINNDDNYIDITDLLIRESPSNEYCINSNINLICYKSNLNTIYYRRIKFWYGIRYIETNGILSVGEKYYIKK
jgi:hypothetical protein